MNKCPPDGKIGQLFSILSGGARLCSAPGGISRSNVAMAVDEKSSDAFGRATRCGWSPRHSRAPPTSLAA